MLRIMKRVICNARNGPWMHMIRSRDCRCTLRPIYLESNILDKETDPKGNMQGGVILLGYA